MRPKPTKWLKVKGIVWERYGLGWQCGIGKMLPKDGRWTLKMLVEGTELEFGPYQSEIAAGKEACVKAISFMKRAASRY